MSMQRVVYHVLTFWLQLSIFNHSTLFV